MASYQNGIALYAKDRKIPIGDPFILRHNGLYYLYPSSEHMQIGIHCFISNNLVDWNYHGLVCDDPRIKGAYAPEVIYAHGQFYMATSPGGKGHYLLVAKDPTGPFEVITDNIGEMIDGTFYLDYQNQLYFGRADHGGIVINKMDIQGNMYHRKNLYAPTNGWTEGPFFIKENDLFYMTYCGNFLLSKGYHVDYATSKNIDNDYRLGINNPLLVSTKEGFNSLGHSINILGPNLHQYFMAYHELRWEGKNDSFRYLGIDPLQINGRMMAINATSVIQEKPKMPTFYTNNPLQEGFTKTKNNRYLSLHEMGRDFVYEISFIDPNIILILDDEKTIEFSKQIITFNDGKKIEEVKHHFNFEHFKTIRVRSQENKVQLYIDQVSVVSFDVALEGGKIGFLTTTNQVFYTAYDFIAPLDIHYVPGVILTPGLQIDTNDEVYFKRLHDGMELSFEISVEKSGVHLIRMFAHLNKEVELELNGHKYKVYPTKSTYQSNTFKIFEGFLKEGKQHLNIKMVSGTIDLKALRIEKTTLDILPDDTDSSESDLPQYTWLKEGYFKTFEMTFVYRKIMYQKRYGMIINATNFSQHRAETNHAYCGYFIGFRDSLLVLDRAAYGLKRIFDRPYSITDGQKIHLRVVLEDSNIKVYVDNELAFETYDPWSYQTGAVGIYQDPYVHGTLLHFNAK